eukprot:6460307-Amphidinium_carterae.1
MRRHGLRGIHGVQSACTLVPRHTSHPAASHKLDWNGPPSSWCVVRSLFYSTLSPHRCWGLGSVANMKPCISARKTEDHFATAHGSLMCSGSSRHDKKP